MTTSDLARIMYVESVVIAGFAHVAMFYIGWLVPYPVVGAVGAITGILGIIFRGVANRTNPEQYISKLYVLPAVLGILIGLFYASRIGPFILFFPAI